MPTETGESIAECVREAAQSDVRRRQWQVHTRHFKEGGQGVCGRRQGREVAGEKEGAEKMNTKLRE